MTQATPRAPPWSPSHLGIAASSPPQRERGECGSGCSRRYFFNTSADAGRAVSLAARSPGLGSCCDARPPSRVYVGATDMPRVHADPAGLEPATHRLTAGRSATELRINNAPPAPEGGGELTNPAVTSAVPLVVVPSLTGSLNGRRRKVRSLTLNSRRPFLLVQEGGMDEKGIGHQLLR